MTTPPLGRFQALLIGIDNYAEHPLSGCVNDIDRVQDFLVNKLLVPAECIRRLEAPLSRSAQKPIPTDCLPTYDNLVLALRALANEPVQRGDRIFIYYAGHGSYEKSPLAEAYFEGLVPLDHEDQGLLFDVELNQFLQAIAELSGDLTVILDCCHSAGITRDILAEPPDSKLRFFPINQEASAARAKAPARLQKLTAASAARPAPQEYTVVAACHADETAGECRIPAKGGKPYGILSSALFELLGQVAQPALAGLRWSDIWEQLREAVSTARPTQLPLILGPKERRVFGGPWQPQDTGHAIQRSSDGHYHISAGSLAGLGLGAQIAVYGPEPAFFPIRNSAADQQARLGVLVVDGVTPARATAWPGPKGATAFAIPPAARGRLIKQGAPDLLRVAVSQNLDPQVRRLVDKNAAADQFLLLPDNDPRAESFVGQYANGDVWIGDDLFGPGAPLQPSAPGPMGRIIRAETADAEELSVGLRAGLNHYAQYVIPLRACRNGGFTLPAQAVAVRVLDCSTVASPLQIERDASVRHEARRDEQQRRYIIANGAAVAFHLHNTLAIDLYVFLLLCNLEGQIEFLDGDVVLNARSGKVFWHQNIIGKPFQLISPDDCEWGIDRLVVIATDQKGMDFRVLGQKLTMNEVIRAAMGTKSIRSTAKNPPSLCWTAVQTLIQIGGPRGSSRHV